MSDVICLCRSPSPSLVVLLPCICIMNNETNWIALLSSLTISTSFLSPSLSFLLALNSALSSGFSSKVVVFPAYEEKLMTPSPLVLPCLTVIALNLCHLPGNRPPVAGYSFCLLHCIVGLFLRCVIGFRCLS